MGMEKTSQNAPKETPSKVQQHHKDAADVTQIVSRHMKLPLAQRSQGIAPHGNRQPIFGDFSGYDYHAMMNITTQIDQIFMRLPGRVRTKFRNRPELVIAFINDPANEKEALKMGLIHDPEALAALRASEAQTDLVDEAAKKAPESAPMPKADPEANPVPTKKGVQSS